MNLKKKNSPGPVLLHKFVRTHKSDFVSATPHYATILYPDGRESKVSTNDLAPPLPKELSTRNYSSLTPVTPPEVLSPSDDLPVAHGIEDSKHTPEMKDNLSYHPGVTHRLQDGEPLKLEDDHVEEPLRRSSQIRKPVDRLTYS
ncbi:hypothetical protein Pcinc_008093 [Petrolisthes cinctipes]|uniref:Uncharacterized protein n=1 Tax=Petrolisthes cinctipes TaxID=88211 RepID=A0AAE1KWS7_PETCI|nr:hypothetical protein Pcinc_008093 [Petrolisthes cinctipes]